MAEILLAGNLDAVSLVSVLQLAESDGLTGTLHAGGGTFTLYDGALVGASYHGLEGFDAAVEALIRAGGPFRIVAEPVAPATPIAALNSLIVESFRLIDDLHRFGPMVLPEGLLDGLPTDGRSTVADLLHAGGLHVTAVIPALGKLQEAGDLRPLTVEAPIDLDRLRHRDTSSSTPAAAPAAPTPVEGSSFDDLLFEARKLTRQRRFDEAIARLQAALDLRPDSRIAAQNLKRIQALQSEHT